jgi:hypothetical protein
MTEDLAYLATLGTGTARAAAELAAAGDTEIAELSHRPAMWAVKTLLAAYVGPDSPTAGEPSHLASADRYLAHLEAMQRASGLFDSENLASPPDTSFTVNDGCLAMRILATTDDAGVRPLGDRLRALLARTIEPLLVGGVHTPNHRWEIASALGELFEIFGDERLRRRAETWLSEGVDQQGDALYSERSPNYAAHVTNPSMMALARVLKRPDLAEIAWRNLDATVSLLDGLDVETVQSRRQDRDARFDGRVFLSQFRRFAIERRDGRFAEIVRRVLGAGVIDAEHHYALALTDPLLREPLPPSTDIQPAPMRWYADTRLARVARGRTLASVFGGSDVPSTGRVASGLSTSAVFLRMRTGGIVVDAVRMSTGFFGLGSFRAQSMVPESDRSFTLTSDVRAGYHQPLTPQDRDPHGRYALSAEPRFFAEMDFERRTTDWLTHSTEVGVTIDESETALSLRWDGVETTWTVEIVLRPGGVLEGAVALGNDAWHLAEGEATYSLGADRLVIGPGCGTHSQGVVPYDPGELVTAAGGSDELPGIKLYVTGRTAHAHRLTFSLEGEPSSPSDCRLAELA